MYEQKLITNYSGFQDRELSTIAKSGIKGKSCEIAKNRVAFGKDSFTSLDGGT